MNFEFWRHNLRARLFLLLRRPEKAMREYEAALRVDPGAATVLNSLAWLRAGAGRYAEAEALFLEALRRRPEDAVGLFNLGFVRDQQGKRREAIEAFARAVALKPGIDRAWYGMGLAHAALGEHYAAAAALQKAAELQPMNGQAWYHLGMAYHTLHQADRVEEVIRHLHRFDPKLAQKLITDAGRTDLAHLIGT